MLQSRSLRREEWAEKLQGFDAGKVCEKLPSETKVIVVERDGAVVACWCAIPVVQVMVEGLEVAEAERESVSVKRHLFTGMRRLLLDADVGTVLTGADTDEVRALLAHVGAKKSDVDLYHWPIGETE